MLRPGTRAFFRLTKPPVFILCLLPAAALVAGAFGLQAFSLGTDPVAKLLHQFGLWGLRFLLATLTITPLRWLTHWNWLIGYRRMLGLFAFFYLTLHLSTYLVLDQGLNLSRIGADIVKRPYITIGMTAYLMLIPLAVTSTKGMMRRLGRRWQKLHRMVYVIATLGVWHFYWQVKQDVREPLIYAGLLGILLGYRYLHYLRRKRRRSAPSAQALAQHR